MVIVVKVYFNKTKKSIWTGFFKRWLIYSIKKLVKVVILQYQAKADTAGETGPDRHQFLPGVFVLNLHCRSGIEILFH